MTGAGVLGHSRGLEEPTTLRAQAKPRDQLPVDLGDKSVPAEGNLRPEMVVYRQLFSGRRIEQSARGMETTEGCDLRRRGRAVGGVGPRLFSDRRESGATTDSFPVRTFDGTEPAGRAKNGTNKERKQAMKMEIYVAGVTREVWFRGSRDERQVTLVNCLDRTAHEGLKLRQTFDYVPSKEEEEAIDFEKVDGCGLVLAVDEIKAGNGGRFKFRDKIDRTSVPAHALREPGAGNVGAKSEPATP
jgi:hypothetical protein